jgi:GMP synthase PP-ATPase subunit
MQEVQDMSCLGSMASMIDDGWTYEYVGGPRAVTSTNGMTAEFNAITTRVRQPYPCGGARPASHAPRS